MNPALMNELQKSGKGSMAEKGNEEHTTLGLNILQGINEARAYARGKADGIQIKIFRTRRINLRKSGNVQIYS